MTTWNNITEEEVDKCENSSNYEEAMKRLLDFKQKRYNALEAERVKAGNRLMSYITDYFYEQKEYYQDEYKDRWYEAITQDDIWKIRGDEDFDKLLEEYFLAVIHSY